MRSNPCATGEGASGPQSPWGRISRGPPGAGMNQEGRCPEHPGIASFAESMEGKRAGCRQRGSNTAAHRGAALSKTFTLCQIQRRAAAGPGRRMCTEGPPGLNGLWAGIGLREQGGMAVLAWTAGWTRVSLFRSQSADCHPVQSLEGFHSAFKVTEKDRHRTGCRMDVSLE